MKKIILLCITHFSVAQLIKSSENTKISLATHAIYTETIEYPISCSPTIKRSVLIKISDLVGEKALVYRQLPMAKVQHNGLIDSEICIQELTGIKYSDGSIENIKTSYLDTKKFVKIWPYKKGSSIIFGKSSK